MAPPVVEGVKALLRRRASHMQFLEVGWFGGEPLLAKGVVDDVSSFICGLRREWPAMGYLAHMTTNGYLLDYSTAERLSSLGVQLFHISLDGSANTHDASRKHANGKGTFARIWQNLEALGASSLPFRVILRVHLSPMSLEGLNPLIGQINELCAGDDRFRVYFKPIKRLGGPNNDHIEVLDRPARARVKDKLEAQLARPDMVYSPPTPTICYASKANSVVVRANGDLAKCTVALNDERNCIGTLREDGTVDVDQERFRYWIRGLESLDEVELACPYGAIRPAVVS
jgi:uncharacterized protein